MELNNNKGKRMPKPYSEDLRERVLKIVDEKRMTMEAVSEMFKIDRKTIYWWRKRREETGSIKPSFGYQKGHSHKIKDLDSLVKFMDVKRDIKVEKIIEEFGNMCKDTVYNYLKKVNYTYKKTFLYQERDKVKREEFMKKIEEINEENLIFIDESGIEDNEFYAYGWAKKGKRLFVDKPGYKRRRVSIIGALNEGKVKAPWIIDGYCNSEIFEAYILDNASFHKSERTKKLIESVGCKVLFLPPCSPDLNPIEKFWFAIKHNVRKSLPNFWPDINSAIDFVFQSSGKPYFG